MVSLGITINILIYNKLVQINTDLVSIVYKNFAPLISWIPQAIIFANYTFTHHEPINIDLQLLPLCSCLLNQIEKKEVRTKRIYTV